MSAVIACMHLKHNGSHMWPTSQTSVVCVELLGHSRQPITGRLATLRDATSAGWQATLCDPMWHVSSRSGVATLRAAIHLLLTLIDIDHQSMT